MMNYVKTTLRNLWKNRGYAALNVAGLAIGIACASLIFLWVEDEVTFDHDVAKRDHIYRVMENQVHDGVTSTVNVVPGPMAGVLRNEITGIKHASRTTSGLVPMLFTVNDKALYEKGDYVDSTFFSIVAPLFVQGDPETALNDLHALVITQRMALKFFETADVVGQSIKMDNDALFTITGVIQDPRPNSSFQADWLARFDLLENKFPWLKRWDANAAPTVVELYPGADVSLINEKLTTLLKEKGGNGVSCFLFPMNDWHLYNHFANGVRDNEGQIKYVKLFAAIACIILVVACINFMNLATARSGPRAKEVGVRKTLGAARRTLISQFIGESVMLAFVSVLIAIVIAYCTLPAFNSLVGKELTIQLTNPWHTGTLAVITLVCGLLAGSYPAFYLSSFNPTHVLKGIKASSDAGSGFIRKGLVVVQFVASIILMVATVIIYQQVQYARQRDLGYDTSHVIYMDVRGSMIEHFNAIKNELVRSGAAENAALSINPVIRLGWYRSDGLSWQGKDPNKNVLIVTEAVTPEFVSTLHMTIQEGRDFYPDADRDTDNILVNETLAKLMGDKSPVGDVIKAGDRQMKVIGVVSDFVYENMYSKAPSPVIMTCNPSSYRYLTIRLKASADLPASLGKIESVIKEHNPEYPFDYTFLDEEFNKLFKTEALVQKLAGMFGALAIFISCLGLFGLAAYTAQRRSKEIGIRKILGASANSVATLISTDFLRLVTLSFVVAFPLAWWMMHQWLQSYEYRTPIYWWVFMAVGALTLIITLATVGFQTMRAALVNPTEVLRAE
ncbi:ABC transporter permease [Fulvivirgaceae bacterium PWU4]|uniref:ABC transporter permease n=1 Tax=Chryseosolibacter histidini TaxID=2782349 RepID=A0AAP2DMK2_9BACT|nr:ABC transporter permease [Chryseosolibacter histidini]MBT1697647.1 ABC transporter permease [Chryseosolibacter histidini]